MISSILVPPFRLAVRAFVAGAVLAVPAVAKESAAPVETHRVAGLKAPAEIRDRPLGRSAHLREERIATSSSSRASMPRAIASSRSTCGGGAAWASCPRCSAPNSWTRTGPRGSSCTAATWTANGASTAPADTREAEPVTRRFVEGINAYVDWLEAHPGRTPWEFRFLDYRPAKWAAEDVIRIRSHGLTRNLNSEVARAEYALQGEGRGRGPGPLRPHQRLEGAGARRPRSLPARRTC